MHDIPGAPQKLRERIRGYERWLRKEIEDTGTIHDGARKRHLLGPLHLPMGDVEGALEYFCWPQKLLADDSWNGLSVCAGR